jgi:hypothetical protein
VTSHCTQVTQKSGLAQYASRSELINAYKKKLGL